MGAWNENWWEEIFLVAILWRTEPGGQFYFNRFEHLHTHDFKLYFVICGYKKSCTLFKNYSLSEGEVLKM